MTAGGIPGARQHPLCDPGPVRACSLPYLGPAWASRRVARAADRRRRVIQLTPAGQRMREQAAAAAHQVDAELLSGLDLPGREQLRETLTSVSAAYGLRYR